MTSTIAVRDEAAAALNAQAWTEPYGDDACRRAVEAGLSLTRTTDGADADPSAQICVGEISRVIHEALGQQHRIVHCISGGGFGADWSLETAIKAVQEAHEVKWVTPLAGHGLQVTDQDGRRWLLQVTEPPATQPSA